MNFFDKTKLKHIATSKIKREELHKIRKGLGINYPEELQRLLIALMLHDFVHTEKHPSKIFQQIIIEDEVVRDACLNHHNGVERFKSLPLTDTILR